MQTILIYNMSTVTDFVSKNYIYLDLCLNHGKVYVFRNLYNVAWEIIETADPVSTSIGMSVPEILGVRTIGSIEILFTSLQ